MRPLHVLVLALTGCGEMTGVPDPYVIRVRPDVVSSTEPTAVEILGAGFLVDVATSFKKPEGMRSVSDFQAQLAGTPLQAVRWRSNALLAAIVPPGLPPGRPTLTVTRPDGRAANLAEAVHVTDATVIEDSEWFEQLSGTAADLYSIAGKSADNIWAVGANGTVAHYDGSDWTAGAFGTNDLYDVIDTDFDNRFWMAGASGLIGHIYSGTSTWSDYYGTLDDLTTEDMRGIDGCA